MQTAHDQFAEDPAQEGVDVVLVGEAAPGRMKQIFTRDSVIGVKGGAIVTRLARKVRRGEELPVTRALAKRRLPDPRHAARHGRVRGRRLRHHRRQDGRLLASPSPATRKACARSRRSSATSASKLIKVPMPGYRIHIDGAFMMIDVDTAIVNLNELPYFFIEYLQKRGMKLIELPPDDNAFSLNCLAIAPGRVVMHVSRTQASCRPADGAGVELITGRLRVRRTRRRWHPLLHRPAGPGSGLTWRFSTRRPGEELRTASRRSTVSTCRSRTASSLPCSVRLAPARRRC